VALARLRRLVSLAALILLSATLGLSRVAAAQAFPIDAVGRLIVNDTRVCTAFVVRSVVHRVTVRYYGTNTYYENWIATAGHCFGQDLVFAQGRAAHRITQVIGYSGGTVGFDVMVASFPTDTPLPALEPAFGEFPVVGDRLLLIGYSHGALMMRISPLAAYDERGHMEINGYASPGSSGGPVLIPGTRRVVGIGIETTLERPANASPLHCMLVGCAVKPPYTAVHIDRILGVARF
jgi:hypothetical protein